MKIQITLLIFLILLSCKQKNETEIRSLEIEKTEKISETIKPDKLQRSNCETTKNRIIGIWTNGSTENATFEIKSKTIYYVDDFKDYDYKLKNDTIEIAYPDYVYRAKIEFRNDTLIMNSKEYSPAKYWKFKE